MPENPTIYCDCHLPNCSTDEMICSGDFHMPETIQRPRPASPLPIGGGDGPREPKVEKPNTEELLKRMRKVDPDQAKRYRQRTGE